MQKSPHLGYPQVKQPSRRQMPTLCGSILHVCACICNFGSVVRYYVRAKLFF